jgi:hypothetical protein
MAFGFRDAIAKDADVFTNPKDFGVDTVINGMPISINLKDGEDGETGQIFYTAIIPIRVGEITPNQSFVVGGYIYSIVAIYPLLPSDIFWNVRLNRAKI